MKNSYRAWSCLILLPAVLTSCEKSPTDRLQGYVEGEFVYPAPPIAGKLTKLAVKRGDQVKAGDLLFTIENTLQKAAYDEAAQQVQQAQATLADAKKGRRPSEIQSLQAQLSQSREAMSLSAKELARQENLRTSGAVPEESLDRARSLNEQNRFRVAQIEAEMATADLGARADQIAAAEAEVKAREATLAKAEWDLQQTRQTAPAAGLIDDTLYNVGEWIAAGRPVISLLPPGQVRVRLFVPETEIIHVHLGDAAQVSIDGMPQPVQGEVSFISPGRIHAAGDLQPRKPRQIGFHGRTPL
ncbi:MAG: HlyD family secretion protein [Verrucomicrobiaceae bacterium]|nr:HlyD family secretion protein [Verrucomicrobiaceae bacterium]